MGTQLSAPAPDMRPRNDSFYQQDYSSNVAQMPEPGMSQSPDRRQMFRLIRFLQRHKMPVQCKASSQARHIPDGAIFWTQVSISRSFHLPADIATSAYQMRTGSEAQSFFIVGKVFAMLYSETASETSAQRPNDDAYTVVRFNERAHTNIRRFVVVEVRRGFVYAW